jgi:acyl carrier protein
VLGGGAAFSVEEDGEERLVVVQEIDRSQKQADLDEVLRQIRAAVAREHEVDLQAVVLIRQASLPRTTSGKPRRNLCRTQFLAGELKTLANWTFESTKAVAHAPAKVIDEPLQIAHRGDLDRLTERIEAWLLEWLVQRGGVPSDLVSRERPFAEYGLSSLTAVELSQDLESWLGIELSSVIAWKYPTPEFLSRYLAGAVGGVSEEQNASLMPPRRRSADEFLRLLEEVEALGSETTP